MIKKVKNSKEIIGCREWFCLETLDLPAIKGKVDTGAKTSSLHAFNIENFYIENIEYVKFDIHPIQKDKKLVRSCIARVIERRMVSDSSGKKEKRFVIKSFLKVNKKRILIEITLANRDNMAFKMLLGREALDKLNCLIDISKSFIFGKINKTKLLTLYK